MVKLQIIISQCQNKIKRCDEFEYFKQISKSNPQTHILLNLIKFRNLKINVVFWRKKHKAVTKLSQQSTNSARSFMCFIRLYCFSPFTSSWPHLNCDVGLEEGDINENRCYSTVYYYNGAQRYEQFLQVGWLYRALIMLGLALCFLSASVFGLNGAIIDTKKKFCLHPSLYLLVS